jgi:hypothetical protein
MAAARTPGRRMGACETTPPTSTGNQHATLTIQRNQPFPALDDVPPLAGVKLVRPGLPLAQLVR